MPTSNPFGRRSPSLRQFIVSYAPDWIVTYALWSICYYIARHVTGFKRHFSLTDVSLQYPHAAHQRVGTRALWLLSGALPLGVQVVVNLLFVRSWWDLHHSSLGLMLSIAIASSTTQIVKVAVGRPRPDLISRCQPLAGTVDPPWGLSTVDICTETSTHKLEDGWRSFPSGHSSLAFSGLGFLTFYLAGKLCLFDTRGHAAKVWLTLVPLGIAAWVAISRTIDYRHHWEDVFAGSALGLAAAYFSYRQYYPHLASRTVHMPFRTRFEEVPSRSEYDLDRGTAVFADGSNDVGNNIVGDGDDEGEDAGLIGSGRKPLGDPEQQRDGTQHL